MRGAIKKRVPKRIVSPRHQQEQLCRRCDKNCNNGLCDPELSNKSDRKVERTLPNPDSIMKHKLSSPKTMCNDSIRKNNTKNNSEKFRTKSSYRKSVSFPTAYDPTHFQRRNCMTNEISKQYKGAINRNECTRTKSSSDEVTCETCDGKQVLFKTILGRSECDGQSRQVNHFIRNNSVIKCNQPRHSVSHKFPPDHTCHQRVSIKSIADHLDLNNKCVNSKMFVSHKYNTDTTSSKTLHGTCTFNERKNDRYVIGNIMNSKNSDKSEEKVKKQLVRHSEPDVRANVVIEKLHRKLTFPENKGLGEKGRKSYKARYAVPELYSSLSMIKPIDKKANDKISCEVLQPETLRLIDMKSSRKLNFSPEDNLFKDLIDLNIADLFVKKTRCGRLFRKEYPKDEIPNLSHVFQPVFIGEYTAWPKVSLKPIGKMPYFDGVAVSRHVLGWEECVDRIDRSM